MSDKIVIDSVYLSFRSHQVLRGVNLNVHTNQVTGLVGRNGCGKSSFLKVLTGQIQPQSKLIKYQGRKIDQLYKERGLINYLPQHVFHPRSLRNDQLLAIYGITAESFFSIYPFLQPYALKKFGELSGGEKRLFEVLMILESATRFSILDEPFTHVMPKHVELIKERIAALKAGKGIVLTDHQYENVLDVADSLHLISDGTIRTVEAREDLRAFGYLR